MTFYQELQLNQAGSKAVIKNARGFQEKFRHIVVYLFKIFITLLFCMAFVIGFSAFFGNDNSIAGVVVLLCIMVFRLPILVLKYPMQWEVLLSFLLFWHLVQGLPTQEI